MHHGRISAATARGLRALQERIALAGIPSSKLDETLTIATWNIRELGRRPRREASLHYIAEILGMFDLIAIVELRDDLAQLEQITRAELVSHGNQGLADAARLYRPDSPVPFERYATKGVRGAMLDAVRAETRHRREQIALERALGGVLAHYDDDFDSTKHAEPEAARMLESVVEATAARMFHAMIEAQRRDETLAPDEDLEARQTTRRAHDALAAARASLPARDQQLLALLYDQELTLEEAAKAQGVSYSTIQRREASMLRRLAARLGAVLPLVPS